MLGQCMHCRRTSDVTITAETGGYLAHYAACWVDAAAHELRGELGT